MTTNTEGESQLARVDRSIRSFRKSHRFDPSEVRLSRTMVDEIVHEVEMRPDPNPPSEPTIFGIPVFIHEGSDDDIVLVDAPRESV